MPHVLYGYDAAYPPDPPAVAAAGGSLMTFYLTAGHAVPLGWAQRIRLAGLGALANYEEGAAELIAGGAVVGRAAAARAIAAAQRQGQPAGHSIFYSVDTWTNPSQFGDVAAVFAGINAQHAGSGYCVHLYGEGALIDDLRARGLICTGAHWLSMSTSFPGYNPQDVNVGLVQGQGPPIANMDANAITNPAGLHAWWPDGFEPTGGGQPLPPDNPGDDDLSAQDSAAISEILHRTQAMTDEGGVAYVLHPISEAVAGAPISSADGSAQPLGSIIREIQINSRINIPALVAAIIAALPAHADTNALDTAAITAAVEKGIADITITITKGTGV